MFRKRLDLVVTVCILYAIVFMYGCATAVPYGMCNGDVECEDKAIRREQRRFERDQLEIRRQSCAIPYYWDGRVDKCRDMRNAWL